MAKDKDKKGKGGGMLDRIRDGINNPTSGGGGMPAKQSFIPSGKSKRFRFFTEWDEDQIIEITMHGKFQVIFPQPCLKYYGKKCPFCKLPKDKMRTYSSFVFTVWEYQDAEEGTEGRKRILLTESRPNQIAEGLMEVFDENGTITDRDLIITRKGERNTTRYKVKAVKGGSSKFEAEDKEGKAVKAKPYDKDKVFAILSERLVESAKAKESDDEDEDSDEDDDE